MSPQEEHNNYGYYLTNGDSRVMWVGITNDPERRAMEHCEAVHGEQCGVRSAW